MKTRKLSVADTSPVTPAPRREKTMADFVQTVTWMQTYAQKSCDEWSKKFAENHSYALSWSSDVFASAAKVDVSKQVLLFLDENIDKSLTEVVTTLRQHAHDKAWRAARYPARSTSPTSNLMEQCEAAAWAEFHEELKYWVK